MSKAGLGMHSMEILNFVGFPAVNVEVCLCRRHLEMLSSLEASPLLLKVPAFFMKTFLLQAHL